MLRVTIIRPTSVLRPFACSSVLQRSFSGSSRASTSPAPKLETTKGLEGPHIRDSLLSNSQTVPQHFHQENPLSKEGGIITGNWVLPHPVYSKDEVSLVKVVHRQPKTISDRVALFTVRLVRFGFDFLSGYKHKPLPDDKKHLSLEEMRKQDHSMTPQQWLLRILFLETVAGVPGMVAGTLRHLRSLRLMKRDGGWIHTLLEESENERMHLMTFMTLKKPSILFRAMVLGAQGVMYNAFFLGYLLSSKTAHRFVGHLEEEAVKTYTLAIEDIENGRLPEWENVSAPEIAMDYWRMPKDAKLIDVLRVVRADEANHRFVNHSLASLDQVQDVNPFALREPDMELKAGVAGLERSESAEFVKATQKLLHDEGNASSANP